MRAGRRRRDVHVLITLARLMVLAAYLTTDLR